MSAPQPPRSVDAAAPAKRPASVGGLLVSWLAWGVIVGIAVPALVIMVGYAWPEAGFVVFVGLPMMPVGAIVGGTLGVLAGAVAVVVRTRRKRVGYGPDPLLRPMPKAIRALLVASLAALLVAWAAGIAVLISGPRFVPLIGIGVVAAFVGVALTAAGIPAIPHVRVPAVAAIVLGPVLALGGGLATVGASLSAARNPESTVEVQQLVQGSPPGGPTISEADSPRIPGPPALYGDATLTGHDLGPALEEAVRYSLMIAQVDDPDIPSGTVFRANFVPCAWDSGEGVMQATTDVWFDTADDAAAIQRVREYWTTNGYTLVVDDSDLVVVAGAAGLIGAQFSIETTWDDELRLRMQSVCIPG